MPNYNEIFMTQFIQTLAQLSAFLTSSLLAVPVYSYYVKGRLQEYNESYVDEFKSSNNVNDDKSSKEESNEMEETETEQEDEQDG